MVNLFRKTSGRDESNMDWFFRRLNRYPRFAHHPVCGCFDHHLIRFGNVAVCLGCTCVTAGAVAMTALVAFLNATTTVPVVLSSWWGIWTIGVFLYLPALLQPFFQSKAAKVMFRTALGASIVLLWYGALWAVPWHSWGLVLKAGFVLGFVAVFRMTLRFRARYTPDPLQLCKRGCYPLCEGNRNRLTALLNEARLRCGTSDPEFLGFAEGFIKRDGRDVEVVHLRSQPIGNSHVGRRL